MCGRFMFHTKVKEFLLTLKHGAANLVILV